MSSKPFVQYQLSRGDGKIILIDEEDLPLLQSYKLSTMKTACGRTYYVSCADKKTRKYAGLLHRIIMNVKDKAVVVDHQNGNGLDCRKSNLRIATYSQNQFNTKRKTNNTKGVWFRKDRGKWYAKITAEKKIIHLGTFATEAEAVAARLQAEKLYHKEFAGFGTEVLSYEF